MIVNGVNIRSFEDGTFYIPKKNRAVEQYMDTHYVRIKGELRWMPKIGVEYSMQQLRNKYNGLAAYVIGKGPSLDTIPRDTFAEVTAPVLCVNESIHKIETLELPNPTYALQQDAGINCRPKNAQLMISQRIKSLYPEIQKRYVFGETEFANHRFALTAVVAINIAKFMGCKLLKLVSFDACVNGHTSYAKCIGGVPKHTTAGGQERFIKHKTHILEAAGDMPIEWLI